jgi:Tetratricopeptide repeat
MQKDYETARRLLERVMERSESLLGPTFEWRGESTRMLAICYCELGRPEAADGLMNQTFTGKVEVMGFLGNSFAVQDSWTKVAETLAQDFEEKDSAGESVG